MNKNKLFSFICTTILFCLILALVIGMLVTNHQVDFTYVLAACILGVITVEEVESVSQLKK